LLITKINQPKLVSMYTGNKSAKFHGNILSLSENTARSFRGATFFDSHCTIPCAMRAALTANKSHNKKLRNNSNSSGKQGRQANISL